MKHIASIADLRSLCAAWQRKGESIALVPTMGNLHAGHLKLVREAQRLTRRVVVSIFVNPLQFSPNEDYDSYPRTLDADLQQLAELEIDAAFSPSVAEMYPRGLTATSWVEVPELSEILCGAFRPGHFRGVATVVVKLLNLVQPNIAVFGEKDYQQLLLVRRMVTDLNFPVEIAAVPTVREADGLAMSSRNQYLSTQERAKAPWLYRTLCEAQQALLAGECDFDALSKRQLLKLKEQGFKPDYFVIRRAGDLAEAAPNERPLRILAAAWLGNTRLIDNLEVM